MKYHISAFYKLPNGGILERRLRKQGDVALYGDPFEAVDIARRMFPLLPKAYAVSVFQEGLGHPLKSFTR